MKVVEEDATLLSREVLGSGYSRLVFSAPAIAATAEPGQFVHLRVPALDPSALRRPFSICDADSKSGELTVVYKQVGRGTAAMSSLCPECQVNLLGPLGRGFPIEPLPSGPVLLVGGGYGVAPLLFLAKRLGIADIHLFVGGRTASDLLLLDEFRARNVALHLATNDGSAGEKGFVTSPLDSFLETAADSPSAKPTIFACGPAPMLRALDERALRLDLPAWLSLDRRMACGVGACFGCTQKVRDSDGKERIARVCKEGPVFAKGEIVWEG